MSGKAKVRVICAPFQTSQIKIIFAGVERIMLVAQNNPS